MTITDPNSQRPEFLMRMYDQMFNDIQTQLNIVWESVAVLGATVGLLALAERQILPLDVASGLIIAVAAWLVAHVYNASYWYNRNLVIIANIERLFLLRTDLRHVHYYFGKHRNAQAMMTHLKIQRLFAVVIGTMVLCFHFLSRVYPNLDQPWTMFNPMRAIPYAAVIITGIWIIRLRSSCNAKYDDFVTNSPGTSVDTTGIHYGVGHPIRGHDSANPADAVANASGGQGEKA